MQDIKQIPDRITEGTENLRSSIHAKKNSQLLTDESLLKDLFRLNGFIEVPILFFLDEEFNEAYYRLSKCYKLKTPKKQTNEKF
jgi:hypothetical protein